MNVSLTPKLEDFVKNKVESGLYTSASEVIREALRLLETRDSNEQVQLKLAALRQDIGEGVASLAQGKGKPLDASRIKQAGRVKVND